jgi:TetR/AcrR family transcriptional repressor of nem operon
MARPRTFDIEQVLAQAQDLFAAQGYNGTSIDDLVKATGLLRGSLYKAFGSKRNLFIEVLKSTAKDFNLSPQNLDLLTVALKDLAGEDDEICQICRSIIGKNKNQFSEHLGRNLLAKMKES